MEREYTVKELSKQVNLSHQAIYNRIEKQKLRSRIERVDSRNTTFVLLNNNEWNSLISEVGLRGQVDLLDQEDDSIESTIESRVESQPNSVELVERMFDGFNQFNQQLNQLHYDYQEKITNISSQVKLLEDSEHRTKEEFHRLQLEKGELTSKVDLLTQDKNNLTQQLENASCELVKIKEDLVVISEENKALKSALEQEKKRPFWKKNAF